MKFNTPEELKEKLLTIYDSSTLRTEDKPYWSENNPTYGQCVPTAILVQELFGGDIYKLRGHGHYFNVVNGEVVDLTKDQRPEFHDCSLQRAAVKPDNKKPLYEFSSATIDRYKKLRGRLEAVAGALDEVSGENETSE